MSITAPFRMKTKESAIHVVLHDNIATLELYNPTRRNAVSASMWEQLPMRIEELASDDRIRVIVLRGAGHEIFCAGADTTEFNDTRSDAALAAGYARRSERAYEALRQCIKPTVAMIDGICLGAGLALALCCDIRISAQHAEYGIPAARIGLGYAYENVARLAWVVGPERARELLLTARRVASDEALAIGLIHSLVHGPSKDEDLNTLLTSLASNAPLSMRASKLALQAFEKKNCPDLLTQARDAVDQCFNSKDYQEGQLAQKEKRRPIFNGI